MGQHPDWVLGLALVLLLIAAGLGYWGLGMPNHLYQVIAAALFTGLSYHRGWLGWGRPLMSWVLCGLNFIVLSLLLKVLLGTGSRTPFFWAQYPSIEQAKASGDWLKGLMGWKMVWQASELANWQVDLTVVQGLLLVLTFFGILVRFQPFASLVAFSLVLVSVPSLIEFNWDFAFPALVLGLIGIYLQVPRANQV